MSSIVKDGKKAEVERTPLSGREYAALQAYFCVVSTLTETIAPLEKRIKSARPGTWRDYRMMQTVSEKVLDNVLETVPADKLAHISQDIRHTKLYIRIEPEWAAPTMKTGGFSYTPTDALNNLLNYLMEHECLMCDKSAKESRKCPHRKLIEKSLPHTVPGNDSEDCKYAGIAIGLEDGREEIDGWRT